MQPRSRRRPLAGIAWASLGILACVLTTLTPAVSYADAASKQAANAAGRLSLTCLRQPATLVGSPGSTISGTPGDDVIVSNGAARVDAGDGDDLICITLASAIVSAGGGNDTVRVINPVAVTADLGSGDDNYRGNAGPDIVTATTGRDVVRTQGGNDQVTTGEWGVPNLDRIWLGYGADRLDLLSLANSRAIVKLGTDESGMGIRDTLHPDFTSRAITGSWRIDAGAGQLLLDGKPVLTWSTIEGFEDFLLADMGGQAQVFVGSPRSETVYFGGSSGARAYGDAGNDTMFGTMYDDVLDGGDDYDIASGSYGTDLCVAEVRNECEDSAWRRTHLQESLQVLRSPALSRVLSR